MGLSPGKEYWLKSPPCGIGCIDSSVGPLKNVSFSNFEFDLLLLDVYQLLSLFPSILVEHVFSKTNLTIHGLTKFVLGLDDEIIRWEELPLPIESIIIHDILSI